MQQLDDPLPDVPIVDPQEFGVKPVNWSEFWSNDAPIEDFLIDPIVAVGRQTAVYSQAKQGKSLFALDVVAAAVTGGRSSASSHRAHPDRLHRPGDDPSRPPRTASRPGIRP